MPNLHENFFFFFLNTSHSKCLFWKQNMVRVWLPPHHALQICLQRRDWEVMSKNVVTPAGASRWMLRLKEHAGILTQGSSCVARQRESPSIHPSIHPQRCACGYSVSTWCQFKKVETQHTAKCNDTELSYCTA